MKVFFKENKKDIGLIIIILLISFLIGVLWLDTIPTNITGDEVTTLNDIYKIIFDRGNYLFSFMGDGSITGINFYWSAFLIKIFGLKRTIFSLRLSSTIISVLSLIPFYLILKEKTSRAFSFAFTLLLSGNYVFLNFSRTAWVNLAETMFSSLFLILFLEKANKYGRSIYYILAGIFAGITLYSYTYGRILVISIFLYLILRFFKKAYWNFDYFKKISLFSISTLIIFLPFFISVILNQAEAVLRRPKATYVFNPDKVAGLNVKKILWHQVEYTFRGFIILDKTIMNEGIENMRYVPPNSPPVNNLIKFSFIVGLIYVFIFERKKLTLWWVVFVSILITQILSDLPPNFARGLFYIPFIYFICGIFSYKISDFLKKSFSQQKSILFIFISFLIITASFSFFSDINYYFKWMKTDNIYSARQPALDYNEFPQWQSYQIKRVKAGLPPVTNYEWYRIRQAIINH